VIALLDELGNREEATHPTRSFREQPTPARARSLRGGVLGHLAQRPAPAPPASLTSRFLPLFALASAGTPISTGSWQGMASSSSPMWASPSRRRERVR
jgi:hypothetical protein